MLPLESRSNKKHLFSNLIFKTKIGLEYSGNVLKNHPLQCAVKALDVSQKHHVFPWRRPEPAGTHFTELNSDPPRKSAARVRKGRQDKESGKIRHHQLIALPSPEPRSHSGFPPVPLLTYVLRIRFCHLKTHQGDAPLTSYRAKTGDRPGGIWRTTMRSLSVSAGYA